MVSDFREPISIYIPLVSRSSLTSPRYLTAVNQDGAYKYTYTKPPECVDIIRHYIKRFSQLVPWKHESVGQVLSGHQLGKPSKIIQLGLLI